MPTKSGIPPQARVLLLGSGLTMIDVFLALQAQGHHAGAIAVSRRGLLPQPHRVLERAPCGDGTLVSACLDAGRVRAILRLLRAAAAEADSGGGDWRDVFAGLRSETPAIWRRLSLAERRRFLRHAAVLWDAHRHRCAPPIAAQVGAARGEGRLVVRAGRLDGLSQSDRRVVAGIRFRGAACAQPLEVDHLINCTGPETRISRMDDGFVRRLLQRSLIAADSLELGLSLTDRGAVIGGDGAVVPGLYYVGPLRRSLDWEATAVPELRCHARTLARQIRNDLAAGRR